MTYQPHETQDENQQTKNSDRAMAEKVSKQAHSIPYTEGCEMILARVENRSA